MGTTPCQPRFSYTVLQGAVGSEAAIFSDTLPAVDALQPSWTALKARLAQRRRHVEEQLHRLTLEQAYLQVRSGRAAHYCLGPGVNLCYALSFTVQICTILWEVQSQTCKRQEVGVLTSCLPRSAVPVRPRGPLQSPSAVHRLPADGCASLLPGA